MDSEGKLIQDAIRKTGRDISPQDYKRVHKLLRDFTIIVGDLPEDVSIEKMDFIESAIWGRLLIEEDVAYEHSEVEKIVKELAKLITKEIKRSNDNTNDLLMFTSHPLKVRLKPKKFLRSTLTLSQWFLLQSLKRRSVLLDIAEHFGVICELLYAIGDVHREVRSGMGEFFRELDKEPSVHSRFALSEEGRAYAEVSFRVFSTHLERRFEVMHKLNKDIQRQLKQNKIELLSITTPDDFC